MMSFLVAGEVPEAYVSMMLDEMELDRRDAREVSLAHIPQEARMARARASQRRRHRDPARAC